MPGRRANATFVTLARNGDVWEIAKSIRHVEDRFNRKFNYDWVFLNDKPFDSQFKKVTSALTSGKAKYGLIPKEHWGFPEWIDQEKARKVREDMVTYRIFHSGVSRCMELVWAGEQSTDMGFAWHRLSGRLFTAIPSLTVTCAVMSLASSSDMSFC
jgi:hypothetical protein